MHPQATVAALEAAPLVLLPVVALGVPCLAAPADELFLVLFRLLALVFGGLLAHVALAVCKDLGEALDCMFIDQFMILVKSLLPFLLLAIIESLGPLPG